MVLEAIATINQAVNNFVWGIPAMVCIIGVGLLISVLALTQTGIALPLVLTAVYAFLSIRFDGTSILDFLKYAAAFLITKQQFYDWRLES